MSSEVMIEHSSPCCVSLKSDVCPGGRKKKKSLLDNLLFHV